MWGKGKGLIGDLLRCKSAEMRKHINEMRKTKNIMKKYLYKLSTPQSEELAK